MPVSTSNAAIRKRALNDSPSSSTPKVDSAIVRMIPYELHELPAVDERVLGEVVTAAFSQRRKMLRNTLAAFRDAVDFDALGFDLQRRAEDVPVAEYVRVAQIVAGKG